jgi:hypothetical protein
MHATRIGWNNRRVPPAVFPGVCAGATGRQETLWRPLEMQRRQIFQGSMAVPAQ